MMTFLEWNNAIARHFFREENAGRTVYLYATQRIIEELGTATGETLDDFIAAMKAGPPWATRNGLCQKAIQSMEGWRARDLQWPPYIGYLALFVLAAGLEGDFAPHSYYPRLRTLLGEPPVIGQYSSFQRMYELWSDLEQWASREKQGTLGILRLDIAGSWMHVGLPVAQTILTEAERQQLHQRVFAEGGLDSGDPLPDAELARIIRENGIGLRPRTLAALAPDKVQSEYTTVLLDRILEELESWTATDTLERPAPAASGPLRGRLLLGLQIDGTARLATVRFYVRLRQVEADSVAVTHDRVEYTCRLLPDGHSTALLDNRGRHLDAAQFDWLRPITLEAHGDLLLRASASQVRIFTDGSLAGVSGYIETHLLDPARPFAVAVTGQAVEHVRAWGEVSCLNFQERQLSGIPAGWVLFTAARATSDESIREHVPQLSFSRHLRRIRLEGGLRLPGMAQYYFRFAPPVVRLEGADEATGVLFNGRITVARNLAGTFSIPDDLLVEDTISASAACAGTSLRRFIYLRDQPGGTGARYGQHTYTPAGMLEEDTPVAVTHIACGIPASHECPQPPPAVLLVLEPGQTAVLVGAQPGQVAAYQPGVLPAWEPVWAVVRQRKAAAARFVGRSLLPPDLSNRGNQRSVRVWRSVLWYQRKRISPPAFGPARALWLAYQDAARHA